MVSRHGNSIISISGEIREAFKGAADLILPYRCALCGDVSDSEDRFENYGCLYRQLYGKDSGLHLCGKCLSDLVSTDEQGRWLLCLSNPVENDPCPGLALYLLFPYKGIIERAVPKIKFGGQTELARFFGCVLGSALHDVGSQLRIRLRHRKQLPGTHGKSVRKDQRS